MSHRNESENITSQLRDTTLGDLPLHGHALCKQSKLMQFEMIDDEEMQKAFMAANSAAQEIMSNN